MGDPVSYFDNLLVKIIHLSLDVFMLVMLVLFLSVLHRPSANL